MSYFTIKRSFFLVPSTTMLKEFEKIDKFLEILEKSGVGKIIASVKLVDKNCKGRKGYNPYNLFATIIYSFAKFKASLRDIEDKCIFDIRVQYIMEGKIPDHSTIGNFINLYILPYQYEIFTIINKQIIKELNLTISTVYLDGTKLEANANKYKFVWKPKKYHENLDIKIRNLIKDIGYVVNDKENKLITSNDFYIILKDYAKKENIKFSSLSKERGHRYTEQEKKYKEGYKYLLKLLEYEEKERICGKNRNSYYKTDYDATAMVLKEDYYSRSSHDFHAAYNVQVLVASGLIMIYGIFQDRADYYTLIPMNNLFFKYYGYYPINESADSGYGIYDNYSYLKKHNIENYVKFQSWSGESSGKRPQLFKIDKNNNVLCLNLNKGEIYKSSTHPKLKDSKFYIWYGCNECNYSYKCKALMKEENKKKDYRIKEISIDYEKFKEQARQNLLSPKGIEIRINRSIQVEGTFGQIKQNMNYNRFRRRGFQEVSCEFMLECLGANIRRLLYSFDENKFKKSYWKKPLTLQSESFKSVKQKKETVRN